MSDPPRTGHPPLKSSVTEIYLPSFIAHGSKILVHGLGKSDRYHYDESVQTLYITTGENVPGKVYDISVVLSPRLRAVFEVNDLWGDFGGQMVAGGIVLLAVLVYLALSFV